MEEYENGAGHPAALQIKQRAQNQTIQQDHKPVNASRTKIFQGNRKKTILAAVQAIEKYTDRLTLQSHT